MSSFVAAGRTKGYERHEMPNTNQISLKNIRFTYKQSSLLDR